MGYADGGTVSVRSVHEWQIISYNEHILQEDVNPYQSRARICAEKREYGAAASGRRIRGMPLNNGTVCFREQAEHGIMIRTGRTGDEHG